jgi:hypothetical protein
MLVWFDWVGRIDINMCFLCVWCYRVAFYFFRLPDHVTTFSLRWTWSRVDLLNFETVARAAESWRELRGRGVVCGIVARAGWRNARRGVVARAVGSWRELWDRGAIWLSWRELLVVVCAAVDISLLSHVTTFSLRRT